jgi:hypothetical protein
MGLCSSGDSLKALITSESEDSSQQVQEYVQNLQLDYRKSVTLIIRFRRTGVWPTRGNDSDASGLQQSAFVMETNDDTNATMYVHVI